MRVGCGGWVGRAGHRDNTCVVEGNACVVEEGGKDSGMTRGLEEGT